MVAVCSRRRGLQYVVITMTARSGASSAHRGVVPFRNGLRGDLGVIASRLSLDARGGCSGRWIFVT